MGWKPFLLGESYDLKRLQQLESAVASNLVVSGSWIGTSVKGGEYTVRSEN